MKDAVILILGAPLLVAYLAFWLAAIVDVIRRDFRDPATKVCWLLVILFAHGLGAALYFLFGRKHGTIGVRAAG